jgi:transposase
MENKGSASQSEARRRLAVTRVNEGWKQKDVATFPGVSTRAVGKWMAAFRASGDEGLKGKPHPGAKPKLSARQERSVLSWLARSPKAFGYKTELWTARRLAEVVQKRYGVRFNSNYLADWLTRRDHSPQEPETKAVGRDNPGIARWAAEDWPRIKKSERRGGPHRPDRRERLLP